MYSVERLRKSDRDVSGGGRERERERGGEGVMASTEG